MTPAEHIDRQIATLTDWRGTRLAWFRQLVHEVAPELNEQVKWNSGVFVLTDAARSRLVCGFGAFNTHVKFNFFDGAALPDPQGLFNNGLDAKRSRSIDVRETDRLEPAAVSELIRAAASYARQV